jgi:hypothetical protein
VDGDCGGGPLGGAGVRGARLGPRADELRRIGVEAEADLAATLVNERREPIRELLQRVSRL